MAAVSAAAITTPSGVPRTCEAITTATISCSWICFFWTSVVQVVAGLGDRAGGGLRTLEDLRAVRVGMNAVGGGQVVGEPVGELPWRRGRHTPGAAGRREAVAADGQEVQLRRRRWRRAAARHGLAGCGGGREIDDIDRLGALLARGVGGLDGQADLAVRDQSVERHLLIELRDRPDLGVLLDRPLVEDDPPAADRRLSAGGDLERDRDIGPVDDPEHAGRRELDASLDRGEDDLRRRLLGRHHGRRSLVRRPRGCPCARADRARSRRFIFSANVPIGMKSVGRNVWNGGLMCQPRNRASPSIDVS